MKKLVIFIIVLILGSYFTYRTFYKNKNNESSLPAYTAHEVKIADFENYIEAEGKVEAKNTRKIFVDKALKVKELFFDVGDFIKEGELIMTFDEEERNKLLRSIERENLDLKLLQRDLHHLQELYNLGGSTKVAIEDLNVNIRKREINLAEYQEELDKTVQEIRSPFEGTIISMVAEENYRVKTETELFEITDLSEVLIKALVPEYDIRNIKVGQSVRIKPEVFEKQRTFMGKVTKIANLSTSSSNSSTSESYVEVEIEIFNISKQLLPGFNADIEIIYQSQENAMFVPRSAVINQNNKNYVFIIDENSLVKLREVELGISNKENIEIKNGLENKERIVANPDKTLEEGTKIRIITASIRNASRANRTTAITGGAPGGGAGGR